MRTLWLAFPAIYNVGTVLLLFFFVWAVIGMNLFAGEARQSSFSGAATDCRCWLKRMAAACRAQAPDTN